MVTSTAPPDHQTTRRPSPGRTRLFALPEMRWAAVALALFLAGLVLQLLGAPAWSWWALYLACYATGGWEPGWAGLQALRDKTLDVDLLMVLAALGAAAIGEITDGALLIVIFATSGALEALATARTEDSVRGLLDLAPVTATVRTEGGQERVVAAAALEVGDHVVVRPGNRLPADGVVVSGVSDVDQASITGESIPVDKTEGDEVFAGTLNGVGSLEIRVSRRAEDSVVARIATLVEQAGQTKARTQMFIEKVEQRYSIGMVACTLLLFVVPLLWGADLRESLLRAMTFMIVASPCAVVLATMPPLLAAIARAGRNGVLVKSAVVMEQLGGASQVVFDKTGTLTRGLPEVADIRPVAGHTEQRLLQLAASAEYPSEHPLARAVVRAASERDLKLSTATDFVALPGRGVSATVEGYHIQLGSPAALGHDTSWLPDAPRGHSPVAVFCDGKPIGMLGIIDQPRVEAAAAVADVAEITGTDPILLTGDNHSSAQQIAEKVRITDVRAGLLPDDKLDAVQRLQSEGHSVVAVGDGINDAPALAAANVGIGMGVAGADLTLQVADSVVIRDDLRAIPGVLSLARRARAVMVANLVIASVFIAVLVGWDLLGNLPLPLGVAGHEGSTVLVALNGLRLLRQSRSK